MLYINILLELSSNGEFFDYMMLYYILSYFGKEEKFYFLNIMLNSVSNV